MSLVWQFYPRSEKAPHRIAEIAAVFTAHHEEISSARFDLNSNDVLAVVHDDLAQMVIRKPTSLSELANCEHLTNTQIGEFGGRITEVIVAVVGE